MALEGTGTDEFNPESPTWGDFVDSDGEIDVEDSCEPIDRYEEGLYYPICIGEVLVRRYRIEHKLGHGGFSTVWMAYDMFDEKDVAMKVLTGDRAGEREYHIQNDIISAVRDRSRLLTYIDTFVLPGAANFRHRVLVFPLRGPNLEAFAPSTATATRRAAAKQLLEALKALHDGGFVHRDLNSANVMFGLKPFKSGTDITTKYEALTRPQKLSLPTNQTMWKEGQMVTPMVPKEEFVEPSIALGDFGLAIPSGTPVDFKIQSPAIYCAPERLHNIDPSFASDIWSYMLIFAELYLGYPVFCGARYAFVLELMVRTLGALPPSWKGLYNAGGQIDEKWYDQSLLPEPDMSLEAKVTRSRDTIEPVEQQLVLSVLRKGLCYLPEERLTAEELLEDESFKELMGRYGL